MNKKNRKKVLFWSLLCIVLILVAKSLFSSNATSTGEHLIVCTSETTVSTTSSAMLYYPCSILEPVILEPLPATTIAGGYGVAHKTLSWLSREIAANDFIVLGMTPSEQFSMNSAWRDAHLAAIAKLKSLNSESDLLKGKIALDKLQVCGHSKGGGGALWAADMLGSELKSTIVMCPWQEEITNLSGIRAPTLIQAGGADIYATREMTFGEYNMLPTTISKAYFEYTSAEHFSWGAINSGGLRLTLSSDIVAWMKYYLKDDISQHSQLARTVGKATHLWEDQKQKATAVFDDPKYAAYAIH